jgi:NAD(P)-dependent dehydrogenase (short-subunit alcohol dehydrogenase family)
VLFVGELDGKVAIITGGSTGIGLACAKKFVYEGAKVVIAARGLDRLTGVADQLSASGGEVVAVRADVSVMSDLERLAAETEHRFGGVDVIVNNAGVLPEAKPAQDITSDEWDLLMATNLKSAWYLAKLAYPAMKRRGGGSVINISSVSGYYHYDGELLYTLPKAGLFSLAQILGKEWALDNIRVNSVAPGLVRTEMTEVQIAKMQSEGRRPNLQTAWRSRRRLVIWSRTSQATRLATSRGASSGSTAAAE